MNPITSLPWHVSGGDLIISADGITVCWPQRDKDAEFIVRAVNAHDALAAVRDAARNVVDCYVGPFDAEIDALRTALAHEQSITTHEAKP